VTQSAVRELGHSGIVGAAIRVIDGLWRRHKIVPNNIRLEQIERICRCFIDRWALFAATKNEANWLVILKTKLAP
jgi:hypothetical protein